MGLNIRTVGAFSFTRKSVIYSHATRSTFLRDTLCNSVVWSCTAACSHTCVRTRRLQPCWRLQSGRKHRARLQCSRPSHQCVRCILPAKLGCLPAERTRSGGRTPGGVPSGGEWEASASSSPSRTSMLAGGSPAQCRNHTARNACSHVRVQRRVSKRGAERRRAHSLRRRASSSTRRVPSLTARST